MKGRPDETRYADHVEKESIYELAVPDAEWTGSDAGILTREVPMRNAMNEEVRSSYVKDCELGFKRWNRAIERAGFDFRLTLPSVRFRRSIGAWAGVPISPTGERISQQAYDENLPNWIPSEQDRAYVKSLMVKVHEPGKMANWIAPPDRGINNKAIDYEYVCL